MNRPKPYDLTTHDGKRVDWITKAALMKQERILGYELTVVQGCYQALDGKDNDVEASGNTHNRGGVVDLAPYDWPAKVRAGRLSGFVSYFRPRLVINGKVIWNDHIHQILECNERLDPSAERQVQDYHLGRDGLASHGPDPHVGMVFRGFQWPYGGLVGAARWRRDQLRGKERRDFLERLGQVVKGK